MQPILVSPQEIRGIVTMRKRSKRSASAFASGVKIHS